MGVPPLPECRPWLRVAPVHPARPRLRGRLPHPPSDSTEGASHAGLWGQRAHRPPSSGWPRAHCCIGLGSRSTGLPRRPRLPTRDRACRPAEALPVDRRGVAGRHHHPPPAPPPLCQLGTVLGHVWPVDARASAATGIDIPRSWAGLATGTISQPVDGREVWTRRDRRTPPVARRGPSPRQPLHTPSTHGIGREPATSRRGGRLVEGAGPGRGGGGGGRRRYVCPDALRGAEEERQWHWAVPLLDVGRGAGWAEGGRPPPPRPPAQAAGAGSRPVSTSRRVQHGAPP